MRLWIDGGSLHAIPRCLDGTGFRDDAVDQLHIAVHLVFADTLIVGHYGGGEYADETRAASDALLRLGFDPQCIEVAYTSQSDLEDIYSRAEDALAPELRRLVDSFKYEAPPKPYSDVVQRMELKFEEEQNIQR